MLGRVKRTDTESCGYATDFMVSFLRFLAQSRRKGLINFW